jgi:hypothetical protein
MNEYLLFTNAKISREYTEILLNDNNPNDNLVQNISKNEWITIESTIPVTKFFGVHFDPNVNYKCHIESLS